MANLTLWEQVKAWKSEQYKWVDLTHELSPETPHWYGFKPLQADLLFDYVEGTPDDMMAPMRCIQYSVASQYGTHTDVPRHFWGQWPGHERYHRQGLMYPLVVIDKSAECAANPDLHADGGRSEGLGGPVRPHSRGRFRGLPVRLVQEAQPGQPR